MGDKLDYRLLTTKREIEELSDLLLQQKEFCFDFETTSLETHGGEMELVGIGFCWEPGTAYYVPFHQSIWGGEESILYPELISWKRQRELLEEFEAVFLDDSIGKVLQNAKYDCRVLDAFGFQIRGITFDTMIAHYCLYGDRMKTNIDDIALHHFGHIKIRTKTQIPRKSKKNPNPSMAQADPEDLCIYCSEDCDWTWRAYLRLRQLLEENPTQKRIFYEIDFPILQDLIHMECNGVQIDTNHTETLREYMAKRLDELQSEIDKQLGRSIKLTVPSDLEKALYDELKLDKQFRIRIRKTKTGRSTDAKMLAKMEQHPFVKLVQEWKALYKLQSTYVTKLAKMLSPITGKLHASFNQHITTTGRLSSDNPNLQNIPQRTEDGKKIRKSFISRFDGGKILAADLSQAEMRILAHLSQDPVLLDIYLNNKDAHTRVATAIHGVNEDQVSPDQRYGAKTINYGLTYGMTAIRLSAELGISIEEAESLMDRYFRNMKGVAAWMQRTKDFLRYHGYVETMFGRRRYIPKIFSSKFGEREAAEREGGNHPIQGCVAGSTRILTKEQGYVKISSALGPAQVWDGTQWAQANIVDSGLKRQVIVTLMGGHCVKCSPEHPFLVRSNHGQERWIAASELRPNHRVVLTEPVDQWRSDIPELAVRQPIPGNGNQVSIKNVSDTDLGVWLGRLASDGSLTRDKLVLLVAEHEKEILPVLSSISSHLARSSCRKIDRGSTRRPIYHISTCSRPLCEQLIEVGIKKGIPSFVWRSRKLLAGYLRGYFDGDGTVNNDNAVLTFGKQKYKISWAREIQEALLYLGIQSRLRHYSGDRTIIQIMKRDMPTFCREVGFLNPKKQKRAQTILGRHKLHSTVYGMCQRVKSVQVTNHYIQMFDVINASNGRFCANGIVVHNSQGDWLKIAMRRIREEMQRKRMQSLLIMQVHDELVFDVPKEELDDMKPMVIQYMQNVTQLTVPMVADAHYADNWADAH